MAAATTGGALTGAALTVMVKVSETEPPLPSVAVTFTDSVPTLAAWGVPLKLRLPSVKLNQVGNALSSPCVAV